MIPFSSKFFYGLAGVLFAAVVYGWTTGGDFWGPLGVGYMGGVGDHLGYGILLVSGVASLFLGFAQTAFRDADPEAQADLLGGAPRPEPVPGLSPWPIVGAFGAGLTVIGVVFNNVFFVAGLIALAAVALEWTMHDWSDRATGDPRVNRAIRNRIMYPVEIPIAGALAVAVVVLGFSRVFLTASREGAVWIALAAAAIVFGGGTILGASKRIRTDVVAGLLVVGAVVTIGLGIWGAVRGEREFEHHGDETEHVEDDSTQDSEEHSS